MELYFETYNNPKLYITTSNLLSLYGSGLTNGLVVESGHHGCTVTPIFEDGAIIYNELFACHDYYGGYDVTKFFMKYLKNDHAEIQQTKAEHDNENNIDNNSPNDDCEDDPRCPTKHSHDSTSTDIQTTYHKLRTLGMYDWPTMEFLKHKALFVVEDYEEIEKHIVDIRNQ
ncbi:actin-like 7B, partial [Reticulomyxa filosa]